MYTPEHMFEKEIPGVDHPYAGYTIFGIAREAGNRFKKWESTIELGVIGSYSGAELAQSYIHGFNNMRAAEGWYLQIKNSPVINIGYTYHQKLAYTSFSDLSFDGFGKLGSLFSGVGCSLTGRIGLINSWFNESWQPESKTGLEIYFFLQPGAILSFYDATLQGSYLRYSDGEYILSHTQCAPYILQLTSGVQLAYRNLLLKAYGTGQTPDFIGGKKHAWGSISITCRFR
jgi:hypothetical protein